MKQQKSPKSALIILSGGQDSTTCLAWAQKHFNQTCAIAFDYGQRHKIELDCAQKIADRTKTPLKIQKLELLKDLTRNALTADLPIDAGNKYQLPSTFVPGRNLIFIATAAIYAKQLGITDLVTGVCQTDYSGYPDCREEFIKSLEQSLNLAMEEQFTIHTPLMHLTKAKTVKLAADLEALELLKESHTCYEGQRPACGKCPACLLRLKGFEEAGINDPLEYQLN